ncbi:transposase [Pseudoduganella sp. CY13W]|uniref:Transposase n=1 Tax=Duganella qianjiadongensis TaxID=2692176 RepID=A0ABW9VGR5_9BURK|nr:transposase [Duganella qianjiadongensis]
MKRSRFTEQQISETLRQAEAGTPVEQVCRMMGISDTTFYNWRKRYRGMQLSAIQRLRQLEEENAQLKRLVAELALDKVILQDVLARKISSMPAGTH